MPFILPSAEQILNERRLAVACQAFSELAQYELEPGYISGDGYLASQQKKVAVSNELAADGDVFVWNTIVDFRLLILTMQFKSRGGQMRANVQLDTYAAPQDGSSRSTSTTQSFLRSPSIHQE